MTTTATATVTTSNSRGDLTGLRTTGRVRSATIHQIPQPTFSFTEPDTQHAVSMWSVADDRNILEETVSTATYPYIMGRAEDIDAMIEAGDILAAKTGPNGTSKRSRQRSHSVGGRDAPAVVVTGDIDGYILVHKDAASAAAGGSVSGFPSVPRRSFAGRLASGIRTRMSISGGSGMPTPIHLLSVTAGGGRTNDANASQMSFAESFPTNNPATRGGAHSGLAAVVPSAGTDSLPESHFPQTLTAASEDIDVLTKIGHGGSLDTRAASGRGEHEVVLDEDAVELDVDKILLLAEVQEVARLTVPGSPKLRISSADRWGRKPRGSTNLRADGTATVPSSPSTTTLPPRFHQAITAVADDKQTDIDDVLASDPTPDAMTLPRTVVDSGHYLLLDNVPSRSLSFGYTPDSAPRLGNSRDEIGDAAVPSGRRSRGSGPIPKLPSRSSEALATSRSGRFDREWNPTQTQALEDEVHRTCPRDDSRAAEDIGALLDIGHTLERPAVPTPRRLRQTADIQTLIIRGEEADTKKGLTVATHSNASSAVTGAPLTPVGENPQSPTSDPCDSPGPTPLGRKFSKVSYTEIDENSISTRHSTLATVPPPVKYEGSLDIDQLFVGQDPIRRYEASGAPRPGKDGDHHHQTHQHHGATRGETPARIVATAQMDSPANGTSIHQRRRSTSQPSGSASGDACQSATSGGGGAVPAASGGGGKRRLTSLDISHFMGIAEMVEADYDGMPIAAGTVRVDVVEEGTDDIGGYVSLGNADGEDPIDEEEEEEEGSGKATLESGDLGRSSDGMSSVGAKSLLLKRRGSSMGHLLGQPARSRRLSTTDSGEGGDETHLSDEPLAGEIERQPLGGLTNTNLAKRVRRSLDELAIANRSMRDTSVRDFLYGADPRILPPTVTSHIVGVRPPKIDIDELASGHPGYAGEPK